MNLVPSPPPPDSWIIADTGVSCSRIEYWRERPNGRPDASRMYGGGYLALVPLDQAEAGRPQLRVVG